MGCRLLVIEPVHCGSNSILKVRFLRHPVSTLYHTLTLKMVLNIQKSAFAGYCKIFWTASTSSASHPKSSVHNVSQVITAFMQQTDSCAHFATSSGIGSAQK